ncbi:MAG: hypothetical protein IIB25_04080 [Chloroflexi bacterium]|nr:hypothetical protein [Chloroflexota bacterium]
MKKQVRIWLLKTKNKGDNIMLKNAKSLFVTKDWSEEEKIGVGDEVYVVGRLLDHDHKERNTPVARFGRLARTGTIRHRSPCLEKDVETFFCDVKSVGGFSGSPVFVEISALDDRRGTVNLSAGRKGPRLLGVDWGHTQRRQPLRKMLPITHEGGHQEEEVPDLFVYRNSGIICVAPAWELLEILEAPEFAQSRQAIERKERSDE